MKANMRLGGVVCSMIGLMAMSACNKSDMAVMQQFEVKQAMTLAYSKKKSITVPVGPAAVEVQFASKVKNKVVESGMVLKIQGKKIPFSLKDQPISIVKNMRGRDVPRHLENLQVSAADSGQNVGVKVSLLDRTETDEYDVRNESCSWTESRTVCRHSRDGDSICWDESTTYYGRQDVEYHRFGNTSLYGIDLSAADGSLAATSKLDVDAVSQTSRELNSCR